MLGADGACCWRPDVEWRRTIPLSDGWRIRATAFATQGQFEEAKRSLGILGELKVLDGQELNFECQAGLVVGWWLKREVRRNMKR